jgi:tetraacyldisaccharide 4'-kinase
MDPGGTRPAAESAADFLAGRRCAVFAGIAANHRFFDDVRLLGARVVATEGFADHHPYSVADLDRVTAAARRAGAECLVTTAKDQVRLEELGPLDLPLVVIDLRVVWDDGGKKIQALLNTRLGRPPGSIQA